MYYPSDDLLGDVPVPRPWESSMVTCVSPNVMVHLLFLPLAHTLSANAKIRKMDDRTLHMMERKCLSLAGLSYTRRACC